MACVLLVEDDPRIREATALRLQVEGHHVIAVASTEAALDAAARSDSSAPRPQVVVLDVEAPGVDDSALRALFQGHDVAPTLPIVFYTGDPTASSTSARSLLDAAAGPGPAFARLLETIASLTPSCP